MKKKLKEELELDLETDDISKYITFDIFSTHDEEDESDDDLNSSDDINNDYLIDTYSKLLNRKDMISYTEVKDVIGYKKKETIFEMLSRNSSGFTKDTDYKIVKEQKEGVKKPINEIYMTIDTLKCICLMSQTEQSQKFRKYYLQMEKLFRESASAETLNKLTNPITIFTDYVTDIKKYKDKDVVYLIELNDEHEYKFGITSDIQQRLNTHRSILKYTGVVKIWDGLNKTITTKVENNIKMYIKYNKINIKKNGQTELFKSNDILKIIKVIDDYVEEFTKNHYEQINDRKLTQQLQLVESVSKLIDKLGTDKNTLTNIISSWANINNNNKEKLQNDPL